MFELLYCVRFQIIYEFDKISLYGIKWNVVNHLEKILLKNLTLGIKV